MIMYQSIPSLTITPGNPEDSHVLTAWGGGGDFESEKFSTVFKDKCRNFSIRFRGTGGSLKSKCSCALSCHLLQNSRCLLYL